MSIPFDFSSLTSHTLPDGISLQMLNCSGEVVFEASGKWLHPLFSLQHFIETHPEVDVKSHFLHDRIAGKAAAALTVRLGFTGVKADLISVLALDLYEKYGVRSAYEKKVDVIACMTESLLQDSDDIEEIYEVIEKRRALGRKPD